jgi:hypothetical protein
VALAEGGRRRFAVRVKPVRIERRTRLVNVATVTSTGSCASRTPPSAGRARAVCRARAAIVVLPVQAEKGGGVTG